MVCNKQCQLKLTDWLPITEYWANHSYALHDNICVDIFFICLVFQYLINALDFQVTKELDRMVTTHFWLS